MHLWQAASDGATLPWADCELTIDHGQAAEQVQIRDPDTQACLQGHRFRLKVGCASDLARLALPGTRMLSPPGIKHVWWDL